MSSRPVAPDAQLRADGILCTQRRRGDVIAELAGLPEQLIQTRRKVAQANQQTAFVGLDSHFIATLPRWSADYCSIFNNSTRSSCGGLR